MRYKIQLNFHHQNKRRCNPSSSPKNRKHHQSNRNHYKISPIFVAALFVFSTCLGISAPAIAAANCDDVKFIFARGSGEALGGANATAWQEAIAATLENSTLRYSFYELGAKSQAGYQYPAVAVDGVGRALGAYVGAGRSFALGESIKRGSTELQVYLAATSASCPGTRFVLGGYSQGAMVISRTLPRLDSNRIIYAATFGDPKLYLPEGKGFIPPACLGQSYSPYRANVPDCRAYEGLLGSYRPYQPAEFNGKLGTWCNADDIMCSSGLNIDDHVAYIRGGFYAEAAREIRTRIKRAFPNAFPAAAKPWASAVHNVAILLDMTASMNRYIDGQLPRIRKFASQVISHGGKVAIVGYRDPSDAPADQPFIICDLNCSQAQINATKYLIGEHGGGAEAGLSAMMFAMNNLDWESGATKSIIVVTDAPIHSPDPDGTTLQQVVQRSLELDPVNVYTLTSRSVHSNYADLAAQTNGQLFDFYSSGDDYWASITDAVLYRPEAKLNAPEFSGLVGDEFYFDASESVASDGGNLRYEWDLDGDGIFERQASAEITQTYAQPFSGFIQVKVTDAAGRFATMSAKVTVAASLPALPEISRATARAIDQNSYEIQYETTAERVLVSVGDAPLGFLDGATRNFTLTDIEFSTTLRLTPYARGIGRGEGITLTLGHDLPAPADPQPTLPIQSNPVSPLQSVPSQPIAPVPSSPKITIPKAPNAGISITN